MPVLESNVGCVHICRHAIHGHQGQQPWLARSQRKGCNTVSHYSTLPKLHVHVFKVVYPNTATPKQYKAIRSFQSQLFLQIDHSSEENEQPGGVWMARREFCCRLVWYCAIGNTIRKLLRDPFRHQVLQICSSKAGFDKQAFGERYLNN